MGFHAWEVTMKPPIPLLGRVTVAEWEVDSPPVASSGSLIVSNLDFYPQLAIIRSSSFSLLG